MQIPYFYFSKEVKERLYSNLKVNVKKEWNGCEFGWLTLSERFVFYPSQGLITQLDVPLWASFNAYISLSSFPNFEWINDRNDVTGHKPKLFNGNQNQPQISPTLYVCICPFIIIALPSTPLAMFCVYSLIQENYWRFKMQK